MPNPLPGNHAHQQILQTIIDYYANDDRILAVLLFGSLARGNWDAYSDLDLDIVTKDDVSIDIASELTHLCEEIKRQNGLDAPIILPKEDDGDVVLSNLLEFSIRYHPLFDTKPAILESLIVLAGTLTLEQIHAAGERNRTPVSTDLPTIVDQCIRYTLELDVAIARNRLWMSLEFLSYIRFRLMQLFTITHDGERPIQFFEANASPDLQARLQRIAPSADMNSVKVALGDLINLFDHDLDLFCNGQCQLSGDQRLLLQQLNRRSEHP